MNIIEFLEHFLSLDRYIVILCLASGFFQKRYLSGFKISKDDRSDEAYKTLFLSFIVSCIYVYLVYVSDPSVRAPWSKYLVSYFTATSLYELIIRPFRMFIKSRSDGNNKNNQTA